MFLCISVSTDIEQKVKFMVEGRKIRDVLFPLMNSFKGNFLCIRIETLSYLKLEKLIVCFFVYNRLQCV